MASLTGTTIGGYHIQEELGRGAMGVVFKARQLSMDRDVALKFLPKSLARDEKILARFMREARAAGQLSHPNVVAVHDVGVMGGLHYIAMELVEGSSIQKQLRENGPYTETQTLEIATQIAEALKFAHARGILHRDVKPDNFLIDKSGRVRLADLGLARITTENSQGAELTQDGTAMGTPHYMSPEQARGSGVDLRSDLYSLGASMYVMATGKTPFDAPTTGAILVKVLTEAPRPLREAGPQLSPGFVALVEKLMAKDPALRPQDAQAVLDALALCKQGQYSSGAETAPAVSAHSPRWRAVALGAGAAVALVVILGLLNRAKNPAPLTPGPVAQEKPASTAPAQSAQKSPAPFPADRKAPDSAPGPIAPGPALPEPPREADFGRKEIHDSVRNAENMIARNPAEAVKTLEDVAKLPLPPRAAAWVAIRLDNARKAQVALAREWAEVVSPNAAMDLKQGSRMEALQRLSGFAKMHEGSGEAAQARQLLEQMLEALRADAGQAAAAGNFDRAARLLEGPVRKLPEDLTAALRKDLERFEAQQKTAPDAREALAKTLYDGVVAARGKAKPAEIQALAGDLIVKYADTTFVREHTAEIQRLSLPDSPANSELEALKADLKKAGWTEFAGEWTRGDKQKASFQVKNGGLLVSNADKEVRADFLLDAGAAAAVWVRHDPEASRGLGPFARGAFDKFGIKPGPGYGVRIENNTATVFGPKRAGLRLVSAPLETLELAPRTSVSISIRTRENSLDIAVNGRNFSYDEPLRPGGDTRIVLTGGVKLAAPAVK